MTPNADETTLIAADPLDVTARHQAVPLRFATRDASHYNYPNTRGPKKWHVVAEGDVALCSGVLLYEDGACSPTLVDEAVRCKRCMRLILPNNG